MFDDIGTDEEMMVLSTPRFGGSKFIGSINYIFQIRVLISLYRTVIFPRYQSPVELVCCC